MEHVATYTHTHLYYLSLHPSYNDTPLLLPLPTSLHISTGTVFSQIDSLVYSVHPCSSFSLMGGIGFYEGGVRVSLGLMRGEGGGVLEKGVIRSDESKQT